MGRFLWALVLLIGVIFIFGKLADLQTVAETLQHEDWRFLLLGLGVQGMWIVNVAAAYTVIYRVLGLNEKLAHMIPITAAANFTNIVAPTAGMSGVAVFVAAARRRQYSPARAAIAGALFVLFDYLAFLSVLALGIIVLIRRGQLATVAITSSAILLALAMAMAFLLYLGMVSAVRLGQALAWMARQINRVMRPFIHREYLSEHRAHAFAHDAAEGLNDLLRAPENVLYPLILTLSSKILLMLILALTLLAFRMEFTIGTLVAGFSVSYLFLIVSPTPAGVGFVEGALTLALSPVYGFSRAALAAIAYRGITFWAPLFIGLIAFRWLRKIQKLDPDA
jgi:hypothetical protein